MHHTAEQLLSLAHPETTRNEATRIVRAFIDANNFHVLNTDDEDQRPWGKFFVIDETDLRPFLEMFFPEEAEQLLGSNQKLSPKILLVKPKTRLSWQEHQRRDEVWRVVHGPVGAYLSETDEQPEDMIMLDKGDVLTIGPQMRHRLVGLDGWGVVAEIWRHTDPNNPSNEDDNRRIRDDFGRGSPIEASGQIFP